MKNARCTKIFTKWVLQTDVEPHMRLHVSLIIKLFKTNRQKYPSPVKPSLKHWRAPDTRSKTRGPRPTKPTPVGMGFRDSAENPRTPAWVLEIRSDLSKDALRWRARENKDLDPTVEGSLSPSLSRSRRSSGGQGSG
jgi:hypothetical protein